MNITQILLTYKASLHLREHLTSMIATFQLPEWLEPYQTIVTDFKYLFSTIFIVVAMTVAARLSRGALKRYFERSKDHGKFDITNYSFLRNAISFICFLIAVILIFYSIPALRALGLTLFASAGILAAILGFASQAAFSNIISGIFIVIFKPFRVGDVLKVGDINWGIVEDITLRHTVVRSFQNERYIIPNSTVSSANLLNASIGERKACIFIEIGISYDSDIDLAMHIMRDEAIKHPTLLDNRDDLQKANNDPIVNCRVIALDDFSVNIRAYAWAEDPIAGFEMKTDLFKSIKERFDREGVEIPFPYRTIVYKNDLTKPSNEKKD